MKFFDTLLRLAQSRRYVSGASNVQDEEVKDTVKLAEILRGILRRLSDAEALIAPEAIEFEKEVSTAGALVRLDHNFNSAVRYYVTFWTKKESQIGSPTTAPILVATSDSDDNTLVLASYVAGRAIIRVEPSFKGIAYDA